MNVLIACEFSGIVRDAFLALGHNALSCDLLSSETSGPHHQGDIVPFLNGCATGYWDLIIAFPDCQKLCVSGNRWYGVDSGRYQERITAARWTENLWKLSTTKARRVCFENPVGVLPRLTCMPRPDYIHPWQFGHGETKKTGLYLFNLPPLIPTDVVSGRVNRVWRLPPSADRWKLRSRTYPGVAAAMAAQWGVLK